MENLQEQSFLVFQSDGNFVLYDNGATDASNTVGKATRLVFQKDGNAVIYNGSVATWSSRTNGNCSNKNFYFQFSQALPGYDMAVTAFGCPDMGREIFSVIS